MPSYRDLKLLANSRLLEAKTLLKDDHYDGACYIAGYSIELALKARICKLLDINEYPEKGNIAKSFLTHSLDDLFILAGLQKKLQKQIQKNKNFKSNWSIVEQFKWSEQNRYKPIGTYKKTGAEGFIKALDERNNGIFKWLKKQW